MQCSLQAKFSTLEELPRRQSAAATFGSCIHHALDRYNHGLPIEQAIDLFKHVWDHPETLELPPIDIWPKYSTYGGYRERGVRTLQDLHDKLVWEQRTVVATEHTFEVPFGEFILTGTVDLIEVRKNSRGTEMLRIVDYKTNKRQPNLTTLHLDIQFTTYVYAALQDAFWDQIPKEFHKYRDLPIRAIWFHLDGNKEIDAGPRVQEDFERLYRCCTEIAKAIEHDVYVPNISGDSCLFCSYTKPCGVKIPTRETLTEDEERWQ